MFAQFFFFFFFFAQDQLFQLFVRENALLLIGTNLTDLRTAASGLRCRFFTHRTGKQRDPRYHAKNTEVVAVLHFLSVSFVKELFFSDTVLSHTRAQKVMAKQWNLGRVKTPGIMTIFLATGPTHGLLQVAAAWGRPIISGTAQPPRGHIVYTSYHAKYTHILGKVLLFFLFLSWGNGLLVESSWKSDFRPTESSRCPKHSSPFLSTIDPQKSQETKVTIGLWSLQNMNAISAWVFIELPAS